MATNVGSAYVTLMPSMSGFASSITSDFSSAGTSAGSGFSSGFSTKVGVVAGVAASVANKAFTAVANSLDSAISRVDTLNNFPTIMSNLGYSTEEATAAMNKLVDGVDGLPTSLDSIVNSTQVLAPLCDSLDEAADLSLAFNNALLASGKSSDETSRAMTQYTQMLSKGSVDQAAWNTLLEVMPAQLNQVAQALLGTEANAQTLYDAMSEGTITFDDFNNAILALNEEGINGFASFEQQAEDATAGIETALDRMSLAVTRNVGNVISKLEESDIITGILDGIREAIDKVGSAISDALGWVIDNWEEVSTGLIAIGSAIVTWETAKGVTSLVGQFGDLKAAAELCFESIQDGTSVFKSITDAAGALNKDDGGVVAVFQKLATSVGNLGTKAKEAGSGIKGLSSSLGLGPWGLIAAAIAAVVAGLVWFFTQTETGQAIVQKVWSAIQDAISKASEVIQGIIDTVWPYVQQIIQTVGEKIQEIVDRVWPHIESIITTVTEGIQEIIDTVWPLVQQGVESASETIQEIIDTVWPHIQSVIETVFSVIQEIIDTVLPYIQQVIQIGLAVIQAIWDAIWPVLGTVIETVFAVISAVISTVMGVIQGIIDVVCGLISGDWEQVWDGIKQVFSSIWDGIKSIVETAISAVSSVIETVLDTIKSVWQSIWNGISSFFSDIWSGIKSAATTAIDNVYSVVSGIKDKITGFFSNAISWLADAGKSIVEGLWNGISGAASWLWDKVSGLFGGIVDGVLSLFGINSPSKVFAEIGMGLMEGLALGVTTESDTAASSVVAAASKTLVAAQNGISSQLANAQSVAMGSTSENTTDTTLTEILSLIQAIYEKPTDIYMDSNKVSSALAARSRTILAGRGLA